MDFFRDPVWQFIGVVIASVALLLTILLYKRQVRRKEILWDIDENVSLSSFNISDSVKSTIVFKSLLLEDVHLIYLTIWNSGNIEILPEDFHDPIKFVFGAKARVLEIVLLEAKPKTFREKIAFSIDGNSIILKPLLLNGRDCIKFKVLVTKFSGKMSDITLDTRIVGISQIYRSSENEPYINIVGSAFGKMLLTVIGGLAGAALFLLFIVLILLPIINNATAMGYIYFELTIFPVVYLPSFTMYKLIKKKISKRTLSFKEKTLYYIPALTLAALIVVALNLPVILSKQPIHIHPPY